IRAFLRHRSLHGAAVILLPKAATLSLLTTIPLIMRLQLGLPDGFRLPASEHGVKERLRSPDRTRTRPSESSSKLGPSFICLCFPPPALPTASSSKDALSLRSRTALCFPVAPLSAMSKRM